MAVARQERLTLEVVARRQLARDIVEFTLAPPDGGALEPFAPGAHITVETPSGAMRRYSLVNDGEAPGTYVIAIKREAASRGGSASMHDQATVGTRLAVEPPANDFPLVEAPGHLLIAGGIGITPILSMARWLHARGRRFGLIYLTRSPEEAAYLDECRAFPGAIIHHDGGRPERFYDFWPHFETPRPEHVYCCGPRPLMEEIKAVSGHWPEGRIHFEDFAPVEVVRPDDRPFTLVLARSGRELQVPADLSILETLRAAGLKPLSSCESGTCGTCRTRLLAGEADHRDLFLREEDRRDNIMICVSRARSEKLVVDL